MKRHLRGIAITLTTMLVIIVSLIGICLISVFIYCQGFVENTPFIAENNLKDNREVYEFITEKLIFQSDNLSTTQDFIDEYTLDCGEVSPRMGTPRFEDFEYDSLIPCFIPVHRRSFLGNRNLLTGWLDVCFFNPHLRIIFFFEDDVLSDVYTELILYGI